MSNNLRLPGKPKRLARVGSSDLLGHIHNLLPALRAMAVALNFANESPAMVSHTTRRTKQTQSAGNPRDNKHRQDCP
jgi:hypothetical protein